MLPASPGKASARTGRARRDQTRKDTTKTYIIRNLIVGDLTLTLSKGDEVLTLNHRTLAADVLLGDRGYRRPDTLTEATDLLATLAKRKDGKYSRAGVKNPAALAWLRANWKVTIRWHDTMPAGVKAYRAWEEAVAQDREAFEAAMYRGDGRLPAKTAGEKPTLTEDDERWDKVDRALCRGGYPKTSRLAGLYARGVATLTEVADALAEEEEAERQDDIRAALNA